MSKKRRIDPVIQYRAPPPSEHDIQIVKDWLIKLHYCDVISILKSELGINVYNRLNRAKQQRIFSYNDRKISRIDYYFNHMSNEHLNASLEWRNKYDHTIQEQRE